MLFLHVLHIVLKYHYYVIILGISWAYLKRAAQVEGRGVECYHGKQSGPPALLQRTTSDVLLHLVCCVSSTAERQRHYAIASIWQATAIGKRIVRYWYFL
jgi:hypothetical protein